MVTFLSHASPFVKFFKPTGAVQSTEARQLHNGYWAFLSLTSPMRAEKYSAAVVRSCTVTTWAGIRGLGWRLGRLRGRTTTPLSCLGDTVRGRPWGTTLCVGHAVLAAVGGDGKDTLSHQGSHLGPPLDLTKTLKPAFHLGSQRREGGRGWGRRWLATPAVGRTASKQRKAVTNLLQMPNFSVIVGKWQRSHCCRYLIRLHLGLFRQLLQLLLAGVRVVNVLREQKKQELGGRGVGAGTPVIPNIGPWYRPPSPLPPPPPPPPPPSPHLQQPLSQEVVGEGALVQGEPHHGEDAVGGSRGHGGLGIAGGRPQGDAQVAQLRIAALLALGPARHNELNRGSGGGGGGVRGGGKEVGNGTHPGGSCKRGVRRRKGVGKGTHAAWFSGIGRSRQSTKASGQRRLRDLGDTTPHLLLPADGKLQGGQGVVGDPACSGDSGFAEELRDRGEATCGVGCGVDEQCKRPLHIHKLCVNKRGSRRTRWPRRRAICCRVSSSSALPLTATRAFSAAI